MFQYDAMVPILISGTRVNVSLLLALLSVVLARAFMQGRASAVTSSSSAASRRERPPMPPREARAIWLSLLIGGFAAGPAGAAEVAGPIGPALDFDLGYGYAAIIVAYLGGLHPIGIVASSLLMALL